MDLHAEVDNRFAFHAGTEVSRPIHTEARAKCRELAHWIVDNVPAGRQQALALTALEETMHWCNAAIACAPVAEVG